jgi:hypothetical protein
MAVVMILGMSLTYSNNCWTSATIATIAIAQENDEPEVQTEETVTFQFKSLKNDL